MSSETPNRAQRRDGWACRGREYIKGNPSGIAQMVADTPAPTADDPEFMARDIDVETATLHGLIESLRRLGAIEKTRCEYYSRSADNAGDDDPEGRVRGGSRRNHYRWRQRAYDDIREYLDSITTFPRCEHRVHIYNPRDSDDDTLACRECGTEYHKDLVAELL
jgi:hypothetical protein